MAKSIARIFRVNTNQPVGVGFWVFPGFLLTCAHVVNQALGFKNEAQDFPTGLVSLDFPFSGSEHRFEGRVVTWRSAEMGRMGQDIAALELSESLPDTVVPMSLVASTGKSFVAKGFPVGYNDFNLSAELTITPGGEATNGWVQLSNPGGLVTPGFSGSPLWEEGSDNSVGMVVASAEAKQVAWMIPAEVLRSVLGFPERAGQLSVKPQEVRITRTQKFVQGQIVLLESKLDAVEADLKTVQTSEGRQAFYERARQLLQEIETLEQQLL
jgi:Trypsin-like peptidase domain